MMVLIAVGLMNLVWMVLITIVIFMEKAWVHGHKLSLLLGFILIFYGAITVVAPWLLPGLYIS
jgi:predicted metal-binding membrane protein